MPILPKAVNIGIRATVAAAAIVGGTWAGLTLYTQPHSVARRAEPVRRFLAYALAGDSAAMGRAATSQPVEWARSAVRDDSAAVREWAEFHGRVSVTETGDTTWVTIRRNRSTPNCSFLGSLTAGVLREPAGERLVRLSATCPAVTAEFGTR